MDEFSSSCARNSSTKSNSFFTLRALRPCFCRLITSSFLSNANFFASSCPTPISVGLPFTLVFFFITFTRNRHSTARYLNLGVCRYSNHQNQELPELCRQPIFLLRDGARFLGFKNYVCIIITQLSQVHNVRIQQSSQSTEMVRKRS